MDPSSPAMKVLSAVCFGAAAALLAVVGYRSLQGDRVVGDAPVDPSVRRAERRRRMLENSPLFAFFLVWLRAPAVLVSRMGLTSLRKYVRAPYARAGYPGGLEDDEVVALGMIAALVAGVFTAVSAAAILGTQ